MPGTPRRLACPHWVLLAILVAGLLPDLAAQATPEQVRRADSLFAEFTVGDSPGAAVAVVRNGRVVFSKGYGLANLEHQIPITAATVFDVASLSKQFTGLGIAMLVQQGRIALTDDVRQYIPELQPMPTPITIDHLVHHTSGMRDWPGTLNLAGWRYDDVIAFEQILTMAYYQKTLNFSPGSEYTYSNTGYNLLAEVIRRATGQSFRAWTDEHLFRPLGMTSTLFRDDHTLVVPRRALGYGAAGNPRRWTAVTNNLTALGSSSLMSSAEDMARWLVNFDEARVGGAAAMGLMRTRGTLTDGSAIPYAFGISHGTYRGAATLSHSGSWAGFVSFLVHFPEQRAGVVVLANTPLVSTAPAAHALASIFLGDALGDAAAPAPLPAAVVVDGSRLDRYTGAYRLGPAWYVRITRSNEGLVAQVAGEGPAPMTARSVQEFWVANYGASMTFAEPASGPAPYLTYRGRRAERVADNRMAPPARLDEFAGTYESDELGIAYPVELRGDALVLQSRQHGEIRLLHRWADNFNTPVGGLRSIEFLRDGAGRISGFAVHIDGRSRNIVFARQR